MINDHNLKIGEITLGTAQLGLNYGISNVQGKPNYEKALKILEYAWENGINSFDTAPDYGNSEEILGKFIFLKKVEDITIISKLPVIPKDLNLNFDSLFLWIKSHVNNSLNSLNLHKIPIYMVHHAPDLLLKDGLLVECLNHIKDEGLIDNLGISIYNPMDVVNALEFSSFKFIQVPINLFDHRLIKLGLLKKLKKKGYTILARSIFLQGLFFLSPNNLPKKVLSAKKHLIKLRNYIEDIGIDIAKLAILFVRTFAEIKSLIIGIESIEQLDYNLKILEDIRLENDIYNFIIEEFSDISEDILNPSMWG